MPTPPYTAAAVSGVSYDIKLTANDPKKPTNQLQYQLQTESDLKEFIRYLAQLESLDFYVNVNTLRLSTLANRSNNRGPALQAILDGGQKIMIICWYPANPWDPEELRESFA